MKSVNEAASCMPCWHPSYVYRPLSLIKQVKEFERLGGLQSPHPELGAHEQESVPWTLDDDIGVGTVRHEKREYFEPAARAGRGLCGVREDRSSPT